MDEYVTIVEKYDGIINDRNTIRAKLVELGLAQSNDMLDALAAAIDSIVNQGAVQLQVKFGQTVAIPAGMHNGGGTVSGVAGDGDFGLQQKTITPTKKQQVVNEDEGYYGLSSVIIEAIPAMYQDVTPVTATPEDTLAGKIIVLADGTAKAGTMQNNGTVNKTLDVATISYTIPAGKHSGTGTVSISLESKTATPTKSQQIIKPSTGKVLDQITVEAIPDKYQDVSGVTATADKVLTGSKFVDAEGNVVDGIMPNNGAVSASLGHKVGSYTIPAGHHNGEGSVSIGMIEGKDIFITADILDGITITPSTDTSVLGSVRLRPVTGSGIAATNDATAVAGNILSGQTAYVKGSKVTGTMANNGSISGSIDGINTTSVAIPAGYTPGGTVNFDPSRIIEMLESI